MAGRQVIRQHGLVVVVGVLALMAGLLLAAVQKVRGAADRAAARNDLRQIMLGVHDYAATTGGRLPAGVDPDTFTGGGPSLLRVILPHLGVTEPYYNVSIYGRFGKRVPLYRSVADPSYNVPLYQPMLAINTAATSYVYNAQPLVGSPSLTASFGDGTAGTIALGEHYWRTNDRENTITYTGLAASLFSAKHDFTDDRMPTFADRSWRDVCPVTSGSPPVSRASVPGPPFQLMPKMEESDGRRLQALRPSGLEVAMWDGSTRTFRPGVADAVFWAAVTPAAGDSANE